MATGGKMDDIDLSSVLYDIDPVVWVPVGLLVLVLTVSLPRSRRLSLRDSLVALWYLFNGIIIHIFLDGYVLEPFSLVQQHSSVALELIDVLVVSLVGFARRVPFLFSLYCILDKYVSTSSPLFSLPAVPGKGDSSRDMHRTHE